MHQNPLLMIHFDNTYATLPDRFFHRQHPTRVSSPALIRVNDSLAKELNIDPAWLRSPKGVAMLAGNVVPEGAEPIATVYAAHQFGSWNPQLGDGRALLLGEVLSKSGQRFDIQLKGSGPTPYSRGGDGLAPLGPVLREYVVSEAMHALGVPTSRSLAAVTTGEQVFRETVMPGAVLTRVARSHIRIGTFQYFAARGDTDALVALADHVLARHYPGALDDAERYRRLLREVIANTARLVSSWQQIGFIHGVMNTDNMLVSGETIDYGPCAFLDVYHPTTVFSSIDTAGRYAYQNQPDIAYWNLTNFAQCLLPLLDQNKETALEIAQTELSQFPSEFYNHHREGMAKKIGFETPSEETDAWIRDLFALMAEERQDFTLTYTRLSNSLKAGTLTDLPTTFAPWFSSWLAAGPGLALMQQKNPIIIPRNHQVEASIQAALKGNFDPFHKLTDALTTPFDLSLVNSSYAEPPTEDEVVQRTFCGT